MSRGLTLHSGTLKKKKKKFILHSDLVALSLRLK